jgi:hypothetical protein
VSDETAFIKGVALENVGLHTLSGHGRDALEADKRHGVAVRSKVNVTEFHLEVAPRAHEVLALEGGQLLAPAVHAGVWETFGFVENRLGHSHIGDCIEPLQP